MNVDNKIKSDSRPKWEKYQQLAMKIAKYCGTYVLGVMSIWQVLLVMSHATEYYEDKTDSIYGELSMALGEKIIFIAIMVFFYNFIFGNYFEL